ncbi:MAG: hypothetical protein AB7E47_15115 [Desulfovibrionaceae bacterium]
MSNAFFFFFFCDGVVALVSASNDVRVRLLMGGIVVVRAGRVKECVV